MKFRSKPESEKLCHCVKSRIISNRRNKEKMYDPSTKYVHTTNPDIEIRW